MPLQDKQDLRDWLARRQARDRRIHPDRDDTTTCSGCGLTADEQRIIDGECVECLAFDFGVERTLWRITRIVQAFATTFVAADPHSCHRLIQHLLDRMEDAVSDHEADVQP